MTLALLQQLKQTIMKHSKLLFTIALSGLLLTACTKDDIVDPVQNATNGTTKGQKAPAIWADCEAFATIATPTNFSPTAGNFDEIYVGANFMNGMGLLSESKPGDQDYNGGRWHVNTLKMGVDVDKYENVCSVMDLDLNDFQSTMTYFECPLLPIRGNSGN